MRCFLAFALLALSAALPASAYDYRASALGSDAAAIHRASPAVTAGVSGGVQVGRDFTALLQKPFGGSRGVPISARVTVPNARILARSAALCFAFPPRCVGALALGLGSELIVDQAGNLIRRITEPNGNCTSIGYPGTSSNFNAPFLIEMGRSACLSYMASQHAARGLAHNASQTYAIRFNQGFVEEYNATPGAGGFTLHTLGTHPPVNGRPTAITESPATQAQVDTSFAASAANWQSTRYADVMRKAIEEGADFPLTVLDLASVTSPGAAAEVQRVSTTTRPDGSTVTATTTQAVTATSTGTNQGNAQVVLREVTTETTVAPEGQTQTVTETQPTVVGGVPDPAGEPAPETAQQQSCGAPGQAVCATQEVGSFDAPSYIIPGVPVAPTFTESLTRLGRGIAAAPIAGIASVISVASGASCPVYSGTFEFVGTITFDVHCTIGENIRGILSGVCILIYGIWGIRRVMSA